MYLNLKLMNCCSISSSYKGYADIVYLFLTSLLLGFFLKKKFYIFSIGYECFIYIFFGGILVLVKFNFLVFRKFKASLINFLYSGLNSNYINSTLIKKVVKFNLNIYAVLELGLLNFFLEGFKF